MILEVLGGGALLLGGIAFAGYHLAPEKVLDAYIAYTRYKAGMALKHVMIDDEYDIAYIEGGRPSPDAPSVLLVHGFTSNKDNWCALAARFLAEGFHVVAPDLPGHGGTSRHHHHDHSIPELVRRLQLFTTKLGLAGNGRRVHLVGQSMGGHIVGVFAALHPDEVATVTLVCPAGIDPPVKSKLVRIYEETGRVALLPQTPEEVHELIALVMHKPMKLPPPIVRVMAERGRRNYEFFGEFMKQMFSEHSRFLLQRMLGKIQAPVMVIWGDKDEVIDVSCVQVILDGLAPGIGHSVVFPDCGHSVNLDKPHELFTSTLPFMRKHHKH